MKVVFLLVTVFINNLNLCSIKKHTTVFIFYTKGFYIFKSLSPSFFNFSGFTLLSFFLGNVVDKHIAIKTISGNNAQAYFLYSRSDNNIGSFIGQQ